MNNNGIMKSYSATNLINLQQQLTQCVLENKGIDALILTAASCLAQAQLIVQDAKGMIIAKAGEVTSEATIQQTAAISYDSQKIGNLYFMAPTREQRCIDQTTLNFIASLVSLEIFKQKQFSDSSSKRRLDFVHDLLSGDNTHDEILINRSRYLGIELDQRMGLIVIDIDDFIKFAISHDEQSVAKTKEHIYMAVTSAVDLQSIVVPRSDRLIVLIPLQDSGDQESEKECLITAEKIRKTIASKVTGITTTIGIGSVCKNLLDMRTSYLEATDAINIGRITFGKNRIIDYKGLGVFLLLPSLLRDNPNLSMLFTAWFGKIVDYDRTKGMDLLKTLETYLDTDGDVNETSARLHIHRNTLRYRLEKLDELTEGRCLRAENRLHYLLLIKIWRLSK